MPRIPRGQQAGFVYHVINRGNGRATIFHKPQDYFGLRLFQTFQKSALSLSKGSIAILRLASFAQDKRSVQRLAAVQGSRIQVTLEGDFQGSSCFDRSITGEKTIPVQNP